MDKARLGGVGRNCTAARRAADHWPIGRTTFQKIAYVATEEGLPTELHYQKGSHGPFSQEVKGLIARLINNGLIEEERFGKMLAVKVGANF
jgi:uncharacterized protein YwgA